MSVFDTCRRERLSAYLDGDLGARKAKKAARHLATCESCRRALGELQALKAALLADGTTPDPALEGGDEWLRISARLSASERDRPWYAALLLLPRRGGLRLALGGVAVVATFVLGATRLCPRGPSDDRIVAEAEAEFRAADLQYQRAVERLRGVSERARARWPKERRDAYQTAAAELDRATERCREVALGRPADAEAEQLLYAAYRHEIRFFEDQLLRGEGGEAR
jgi:hypothetical protein